MKKGIGINPFICEGDTHQIYNAKVQIVGQDVYIIQDNSIIRVDKNELIKALEN